MYQIVPVDSSPNQSLQVTLNVNGDNKVVDLRLWYNEVAAYWVLTIIEPVTGNILIDSIPLMSGDYPMGNILASYSYMNLGSLYVVNFAKVPTDRPDHTNLGTDFLLIWGDDE
jgi:hypothetical protein